MAETILIVENNPETLELLRRIMERDGYETILANDGEKGLAYAYRYKPDLIILDRLIPKLNGLQLCRKLKERDDTRHIPVVFLTILDAEQDIIEGLKAGADDYISKPFSPDELSVRVERVLFRSIRSTIEDLLSETTAADSRIDCLEVLGEKLLNTEKSMRNKLKQRLATLVEHCNRWNTLLRSYRYPSRADGRDTEPAVSNELRVVEEQNRYFTNIDRDYRLIRWLASLLYRQSSGAACAPSGTDKTRSRLRRMYAESTIILHKIAAARHVIYKTRNLLLAEI
jgi:DNA-binding response OmpR family regulator